jgi:hypothetical protein
LRFARVDFEPQPEGDPAIFGVRLEEQLGRDLALLELRLAEPRLEHFADAA